MRKASGLRRYLGNERLVFLHQLIQVLLVLLHPLQKVHLLMLQQSKLLIYLEDKNKLLQRAANDLCPLKELYITNVHSPIHTLMGK